MSPQDRLYTRTHEWIKVEGDKASVGLTAFAVAAIKDIVFVELPAQGKALEAGKPFGVVESVKAVFDLNAPLGGTVAASNKAAESDFSLLASDPYAAGWLLKLESLTGDRGTLLDAAAYDQFCASEHH